MSRCPRIAQRADAAEKAKRGRHYLAELRKFDVFPLPEYRQLEAEVEHLERLAASPLQVRIFTPDGQEIL